MPEAAPDAPPAEDMGGKGDPKEAALKLAEKVRDLSSDLAEAFRTLTGDQAEMGDMEQNLAALPKAASETLLPLHNMRKQLNTALVSGMKKSLAVLREHDEELQLIATVINSDVAENKEYVDTIIEDALNDANVATADATGLMQAYAKYVRGVDGLVKRAEEASEDVNDARKKKKETKEEKEEKEEKKESKKSSKDEDDCMADDGSTSDENDAEDSSEDDNDADFSLDADDLSADFEDDFSGDHEHGDLEDPADGVDMEDLTLPDTLPEGLDMPEHDKNDTMVDLPPGTPVPQGAKAAPMAPGAPGSNMPAAHASFDLTTKAGRTAYRAKLAADATGKEDDGELKAAESMGHSDMLDQADKLADGQTELDVKPSDNLGLVETLPEVNKEMLDVAKAPPKVRKEAERLNQLISEGAVKVEELDGLVAQGLDPDVVKYWRSYYGEAGKEGSEFAKLLTTETFKAKQAQEMGEYKVKIARAYELANEMVKRGLLTEDRTAITAQVDEIMQWNDEAFESMKRVIAKHTVASLRKEAGVPQVGLIGSGDVYTQNQTFDFQSELDRAFAGRKY
jgi:hypothetical protein